MANRTNYHSHCSFCDGKASMEEFVEAAVRQGFTAYGISSHAPLPFSTFWTLNRTKVPAYLAEFRRLKKKYKEEIELYVGMEIDYLNPEQHPATDYFQHLPLDYRIGSVHLIYTPAGQIIDTDTSPENFRKLWKEKFQGDLRRLLETYFEASMRLVEAGGFDFVGHANKIFYNAEQSCPGITEEDWYKKKLSDFFVFVAEKGLMVEINTKAYIQKNCFFPSIRDWKILQELQIPIVVNSDAHRPELIHAGRAEALQQLKEKGFKTVMELREGKWQEVPII
ncbi:histidinol-phosphatase [Odoribacter laneus]|uniref:histidinol-phosphatase n=1 Tax=Odoribacter laneus TaxID=626933 RepID=UPI0039940DB0